jgi:hypothetical protein
MLINGRVVPPEVCCRDPERGPVQPGHRCADLVGPLQRPGERLSHRIISHRCPASRERVDGAPQARSDLPEHLFKSRPAGRLRSVRLLAAHV